MKELRLSITAPGDVVIEGDLDSENASGFESLLGAIWADGERKVTLDLSGLDIEDGIALATTINALRELRARVKRVVIKGAPQMLGHNLYRAGMLEAIELIDMREDEPAGF